MAIKLRTQYVQQEDNSPPVGKRIKLRRLGAAPEPRTRAYVDSIEEYIFSVPKVPIRYVDLVVNWIVPYDQKAFQLFGVGLKITPMYQHCPGDLVKVTGLLIEVKGSRPHRMQKISGPVGLWHGKIKFFAKANMDSK